MTREQFRGSLLGQCLGDALGFPVEGASPERCHGYVDRVLNAGRAGAVGRPPYPFGQYTDDSQLARELLCSVVARDGFQPADFAARIAALFAEDGVVGQGRATEQAARRLSAGIPWQHAGAPPPASMPLIAASTTPMPGSTTSPRNSGRIAEPSTACFARSYMCCATA